MVARINGDHEKYFGMEVQDSNKHSGTDVSGGKFFCGFVLHNDRLLVM